MVFKGSKDDSKGIKMKQYKYQINGNRYEVSVETPAADGTIAVTVNGETYSVVREPEPVIEKKKVVILHEYFPDYSYDNVDDYPHAAGRTCLRFGEWLVMEKILPMEPDAALNEVERFCKVVRPDIVVGITAGIKADQFKSLMKVKPDCFRIAGLGIQDQCPPFLLNGDFFRFIHQPFPDAFPAECFRHPQFRHQQPV